MKRTRLAGLNPVARALIAQAVSVETIGSLSAVWHNLKRYTLPDGTTYTEFQQAVVNSITQVYFLALKDSNGQTVTTTVWTNAEMKTW